MKTRIFLIILSALFFIKLSVAYASSESAYSVTVVVSNDSYIVCDVTFDSFLVTQKFVAPTWYSAITLPGCAYTDKDGLPMLPVTSLVLGIPPSGTPRLSISNEQIITKVVGDIVSVKVPEWAKAPAVRGLKTLELDYFNDWYPLNFAQIGVSGFIRSQRILQIELHPVRYLAKDKVVQILKSVRVRVDFQGKDKIHPADSRLLLSGDREDGFETVFKNNLANYHSSKQWRIMPQANKLSRPGIMLNNPNRLKILIQHDGVYAITGSDIKKAGVDLGRISPPTLQMLNRGRPIPIHVEGGGDGSFDENDRLLFIGKHNHGADSYFSFFSDLNVYWLIWGEGVGARFGNINGALDGTGADTVSYSQMQLHLEKDLKYERMLTVLREDVDHWFWQHMTMDGNYDFMLPVLNPKKGDTLEVRVGFQGSTYLPASPDHHVVVKLNGQTIGDAIWDNQHAFIFESGPKSSDLLAQGEQIVTFEIPADLPGVNIDRVLLNWIEVKYKAKLQAVKDSLHFTLQPQKRKPIKMTGFQDDKVYVFVEQGRVVTNLKSIRRNNSYTYLFSYEAIAPTEFTVIGESRFRRPLSIVKDEPSNLHDTSHGADYIIITHRDFMTQAQRLADHRAAEGLRTFVADVADIYDEFSDGIFDPYAIRNFIKYTYENWQKPAPLYVLLFGDTTHLMEKAVASQQGLISYVPSIMIYTGSWGMTSSDNSFVAVSGDDLLPDMYIGRFPVNNTQEADILVNKTINYESKPIIDGWRRNVCLLYGDATQFESDAWELHHVYTPKHIMVNHLSTNVRSPYYGSTEDLAAFFNNGQALLNFIGHGGGGVYFDNELFLKEDVSRLHNNGKYPIVFSLTCFVGHFDNPEESSLAEVLLREKDSGIVGHFGSAARASLLGDHYLNIELWKAIFVDGSRRLGHITTLGKYGLIKTTNGYWDTIKHFNLLGDPALLFYISDNALKLTLSDDEYFTGDKLTVSGHAANFQGGNLILTVHNDEDSLLVRKELLLQNADFNIDLLAFTPDVVATWRKNGQAGNVRAVAYNESADAAGNAQFDLNKQFVANILLDPSEPFHQESVHFIVQPDAEKVNAMGGIEEMFIEWSTNKTNWNRLAVGADPAGNWNSISPLQHVEGTRVFYRLLVNGKNGSSFKSGMYEYQVKYRADLILDQRSIRIFGENQTFIGFTVTNEGDLYSGPFSMEVFEGTGPVNYKPVGSLTVPGVRAMGDTSLTIIWNESAAGDRKLWFNLDVQNQVEETNENNNITIFPTKVVSAAEGSNGNLYSSVGDIFINVPDGAVAQNTSAQFSRNWDKKHQEAVQKSSLVPIKIRNDASVYTYTVAFADSHMILKKEMTVGVFYDKNDPAAQAYIEKGTARLYAWNNSTETWQGLESEIDEENTIVKAKLPLLRRTFALMASDDQEPPAIHIGVLGQNFADGDIVSTKPTFNIYIEDLSGLDIGAAPVSIYLDEDLVIPEQYKVYQNPETQKSLSVTYTPSLAAGEHHLKVDVKDINGNLASREIYCQVVGKFNLTGIANHPNPFAQETTIAFTLTEMASEVKLRIYTVSGRMVRNFTINEVTGYVEIDWDGLDESGNDLANGVYYLKFTAKNGDKTIESIEKMAKLQ